MINILLMVILNVLSYLLQRGLHCIIGLLLSLECLTSVSGGINVEVESNVREGKERKGRQCQKAGEYYRSDIAG